MTTVALIGPDGAGKTTVGKQVAHQLTTPVRYLYMGVNVEESNVVLPTTWLVRRLRRTRPAPHAQDGSHGQPPKPRPTDLLGRTTHGGKALLRLVHWLSEEWFRQVAAGWHTSRGRVVVFDRHFFSDYHASDIVDGGDRPLTRRLHGAVLRRWYPHPDLVIYLDAPAEVLLARKGEGTVEWLEQRRRDYLALRELVPAFAVVDASRSLDEVAEEVAGLITELRAVQASRRRRRRRTGGPSQGVQDTSHTGPRVAQ